MKKVLWFLIALVGFSFGQTDLFEFKSADQKWDRWDNVNRYYVWDINAATAADSTLTSKQVNPSQGFDGLLEFVVKIDTFGAGYSGDTLTVVNGEFSRNGVPDTVSVFGIDSTGSFSVYFLFERYYGPTIGWVSEDTLEWCVLSPRGVDSLTVLNSTHIGNNYIAKFNPSNPVIEQEYQADSPKPWRVAAHAKSDGDDKTFKLKLVYFEHLPNRGR